MADCEVVVLNEDDNVCGEPILEGDRNNGGNGGNGDSKLGAPNGDGDGLSNVSRREKLFLTNGDLVGE